MHFFYLIQKPALHGVLFFILSFVLNFIIRPRTADNVWVVCGLAYCCFIVSNTILLFYDADVWQYFFTSIGVSVLYVLAISFTAGLYIDTLELDGSGESSMMFLVIIYHPIALLFAIFMKWIFLRMI